MNAPNKSKLVKPEFSDDSSESHLDDVQPVVKTDKERLNEQL